MKINNITNFLFYTSMVFSLISVIFCIQHIRSKQRDDEALENLFQLIETHGSMNGEYWMSFYVFKKHFGVTTKHEGK